MPSTTRRPNRTSPTTIILVAVLLGAVVAAARLVTPPPAQPPKEVKETPMNSPMRQQVMMQMKAEEQRHQKQMMDQMRQEAGKRPAVKDPTTVEIDNSYFIKHKPGEEGLKQVDAEMKVKKAAYDAYQKSVAAEHKNASPAPTKSPMMAPQ